MSTALQHLFRYKAWANDALLTALAQLDPAGPTTPLAIKAISHTYVVDRIFAAHLRGEKHDFGSANLSRLPKLPALATDLRTSDREYVDYVSILSADDLAEVIDFTFTDGAAGRMSREEMLMHVLTHGVGHRGQVSAVMLLNSVVPPHDGFTTYLHLAEAHLRRRN